jgi:hypothetical protein
MRSTLRLILLSVACFVALPARADMIPPEADACRTKQVGAACSYSGGTGTCQNQTCHHFDYSNWDRDASTSPPSTSYACVECLTATDTNTNTNMDGGDSPSKDGGSCSIGKQSSATRVAPWLLAAAFSSLFLIGRKRRR